MKIRTKLQLIIVLCGAVVVTLTIILYASLQESSRANNEVARAERIASDVIEQRIVADEYLLYRAERSKEQWFAKDKTISTLLGEAHEFRGENVDHLVAALEGSYEDARALFLQIVQNHERTGEMNANRIELEKRLASQVLIETQSMVTIAFELAETSRNVMRANQNVSLLLAGVCLFVFTVLIASIILLFQKSVVTPLKKLEEGTRVIAKGNLDHRVLLTSKDELGELASSFNNMAEQLKASISKLKKEHATVSAERNKFALVLSGVGDAVIALDKNRRIVLFNPAAEALTGFSAQKAQNQPIESVLRLFDEKEEIPWANYCSPLQRSKKATFVGGGIRLISQAGVERTVNVASGCIEAAHEVDVQCIMTIHDLSKELAAEKQKVQFIAVTAHQMRTPLTGIRWALDALLHGDYGKMSAKQKQLVGTINETSQAMISIVNDLLDVSRIEKGGFTYTFTRAPFKPFLLGVVNSLLLQTEKKHIALDVKIEGDIPDFEFDSEKLRVGFVNLLENAISYTGGGGSISLSAKRVGEMAEVIVRDSGIGIPAEDMDHVFTKFYRASNAVRTKTEGSGLGLFLAKKIVEDHHGTISLHSEVSKGTTVVVRIPLKKIKGI